MNKLIIFILIGIFIIYCEKTTYHTCECSMSCEQIFNNCTKHTFIKCDCWESYVKCLHFCSNEETYGCFNKTYVNKLCKLNNCPSYQCYFPTTECIGCNKQWDDCHQTRCICDQQLIQCQKSISIECYQYNLFNVIKDCFAHNCECLC